MASGLGFEQALFFKESATYGSAEDLSSSALILPIKSDISLKRTQAEIVTEHMRSSASKQQEEQANGLIDVTGSFGGTIPATPNFTYMLKHALGAIISTGSSPTLHDFNWNDKLFPGLSFAHNAAGASYAYHGCQIQKLEINIQVGLPVTYVVSIVGKTEVVSATITPPSLVLLAATPYYLGEMMTFQIDDVTESINQLSLVFENQLMSGEAEAYALGSNERVGLGKSGHTVTGTLVRRHDKDGSGSAHQSKFYDEFIAGTLAKFEGKLLNPDDADYYIEVVLDKTKIVGEPKPVADGRGHMTETITFEAYDLDAAESWVKISDNTATPVTATGAYDATGT